MISTAGGASAYLKQCHPAWNTVGRVTFHLAENKRNVAYPFAFLATYAHRISEQGKVQHLPLGRALEEYAGAQNRAALAALLTPVQRAAELSPLGRDLLQSRAVFHPQVWRPDQAFAFLNQIPTFEQAGLIVRIPDWWKAGRPPRPQVTVRIGDAAGGGSGGGGATNFEAVGAGSVVASIGFFSGGGSSTDRAGSTAAAGVGLRKFGRGATGGGCGGRAGGFISTGSGKRSGRGCAGSMRTCKRSAGGSLTCRWTIHALATRPPRWMTRLAKKLGASRCRDDARHRLCAARLGSGRCRENVRIRAKPHRTPTLQS